jgi:hypothetical protein
MDAPHRPQRDTAPKVVAAFIFLLAAINIARLLVAISDNNFPGGMPAPNLPVEIAFLASPFAFLCASVFIFLRPRFGYAAGVAAGLMALPWFVLAEHSMPWNSWIFLNYEAPDPSEGIGYVTLVKLKILSAMLTVVALAVSSLRLFSCARTWPAFAISFVVMAMWFVRSVTPYSVPGFDHSVGAQLRILHVQKRGLHFHETTLIGFRDGRVYIFRANRRLFQYRFVGQLAMTSLEPTAYERARNLVQSSELWKLSTGPPKALRSWNADGWYVVLKDSRVLAFTTEYGTPPPDEVTGLFNEIQKLPALKDWPVARRDVCLGFCYDPVAALGFSVLPQRIRLISDHQMKSFAMSRLSWPSRTCTTRRRFTLVESIWPMGT